ncbi:MAG: hypothetical protein KDC38_06265 [Planctomycetes bacterium]|nr:hypothetical protein [Planctomycetota bacterium]
MRAHHSSRTDAASKLATDLHAKRRDRAAAKHARRVTVAVARFLVVVLAAAPVSAPRPLLGQSELLGNYREVLEAFDALSYERLRVFYFEDDRSAGAILSGNVHLVTDRFELWADRAAVWIAPPVEPPSTDAKPANSTPDGGIASRLGDRRMKLFAEGHIVVFRGEASFRGESVFFDSSDVRAVITEARVRAFLPPGRQVKDLFDRGAWSARDVRQSDVPTEFDDRASSGAAGYVASGTAA